MSGKRLSGNDFGDTEYSPVISCRIAASSSSIKSKYSETLTTRLVNLQASTSTFKQSKNKLLPMVVMQVLDKMKEEMSLVVMALNSNKPTHTTTEMLNLVDAVVLLVLKVLAEEEVLLTTTITEDQ